MHGDGICSQSVCQPRVAVSNSQPCAWPRSAPFGPRSEKILRLTVWVRGYFLRKTVASATRVGISKCTGILFSCKQRPGCSNAAASVLHHTFHTTAVSDSPLRPPSDRPAICAPAVSPVTISCPFKLFFSGLPVALPWRLLGAVRVALPFVVARSRHACPFSRDP